MSQPPPASGHAAVPSTDFGETTVSGTPVAENPIANGAGEAPPIGDPFRSAPWTPGPPPPVPGGRPIPGPIAVDLASAAPPPGPDHGPGPARPAAPRQRGPRRARLQLRHINPWTVLKFSCVLAVALFFVWLIVIGLLYGVLDAAGAVGKVNDTVTTINGSGSKAPVTAGVVFGGAAIVGLVNVVLFIALSTVGSIIYNLCADLVGGVELTLSEA